MAIITCPECGQHPVSASHVPTCPKCGCPISAGSVSAVGADSSSGSSPRAPTVRDQRRAQLPPGASLSDTSEFADTDVMVNLGGVDLPELVENISGMVRGTGTPGSGCEAVTWR